jgi:hypothetical protein
MRWPGDSKWSLDAVFQALDSLVGSQEWVGNVEEVGMRCCEQGNSATSDYAIRKILREKGESLGRGQYRVTRKALEAKGGNT